MSEITKLYDNAGVDKETKCNDLIDCPENVYCDACPYAEYYYPPFTARKQLSLIIFLSYEYDKGLLINLSAIDKDIDIHDFELFGECLAKLVNNLWQDLTKKEKQQIKEILE